MRGWGERGGCKEGSLLHSPSSSSFSTVAHPPFILPRERNPLQENQNDPTEGKEGEEGIEKKGGRRRDREKGRERKG